MGWNLVLHYGSKKSGTTLRKIFGLLSNNKNLLEFIFDILRLFKENLKSFSKKQTKCTHKIKQQIYQVK